MSVYHQCGDCQLLEAGSYNKRKAHVGPRTVGGVASPCNAWGAKRHCQYSHPVVMCTISKKNTLERHCGEIPCTIMLLQCHNISHSV